ncbi:hypothetical protein J2X12_002872 [Pseudarthrobacter oxydans]|uniref:Uncharacterized protein n=1 Tax=Pseudarthrobacter oxydans TaxID=1671 RepID=A0AAW8NEL9_PSEOX|nr:hypothetical protein [Pseudarthrobacter oxydans]MDR6794391.1 hypothetical protein [Pseudarthrobacter oxydans]MDR7164834.1 hypothetical protein [Pseudarthrobacter oxydans]
MSRWERVDSACLVGILAFLLLLAGSYLPQQHATAAPAAPAPVAVLQVTGEAVELTSEPSGIGGMTIAELHADAAAALATLPQQAPSGQYTGIPQYVASYEGSVPTFPATYFTLESNQRPGVFHVFNVVAALRA